MDSAVKPNDDGDDGVTSGVPVVAPSPSMPPKIPLAPMKRVQAKFNPLADGMLYLVVFVGGCVGTGLRYGLGLLMPSPAATSGVFSAFHPATFIANMCACFIFATLSTYMTQAVWVRKRARQLCNRGIGMGFCGGFSTLSAMAIEELTALHDGQIAGFALYTLVSFIVGLIVAGLGVQLALALSAKRSIQGVHRALADAEAIPADAAVSTVAASSTSDASGASGRVSEPAPITGEITMVPDPMRGEAREEKQK
ncbi:camphor resistance protein CrcB [Bifidobacterium goeldii]|uniref:Fluoride-specific ion channel FluC n=1 Tax=Bifidobacterium goeldii TaxID=2306975 RepID=A0A430FHK2_9BIFI|nr:CrcB family protein [Bifidobacterium goeldii]RSX52242.1 camphor resistance protein CrcB [Bifidobacterium goeldii]